MLIEFEVGNYLSFKNKVTLSMVAANALTELRDENTFEIGRYRLLKSAVIYGANASGKSNLLKAMKMMTEFVQKSSTSMQVNDEIPVIPFKFDSDTENEPSHFEVTFLIDQRRYRYGFEATGKAVTREWLFYADKQAEKELFLRKNEDIEITDEFSEGKDLIEKTRPNALFLSVAAQFNGKISGDILKWYEIFTDLFGAENQVFEQITIKLINDGYFHQDIIKYLQAADLGIQDFILNEDNTKYDSIPNEIRDNVKNLMGGFYKITTVHKKFKNMIEEGKAFLDFSQESEGTKRLFRVLGPLLLYMQKDSTICMDELGSKLHPLLTRVVVQLFHSSKIEGNHPQLIFATHDTNLLQGLFRRDQVWFTEKDQHGATDLYSLAEFKTPEGESPRKGEQFEKNYIKGKYGAIPFLGDFSNLFEGKS